MRPHLGKVRGRVERWQAAREKAQKEWRSLSVEERASPRGAFLGIQALGGAVCHAAVEEDLLAQPRYEANEWVVWLPGGSVEEVIFCLDLWVRPRSRDGRHDAELHDGWVHVQRRWPEQKPARPRRRVLYKGTVEACVAHAKALFTRWDAVRRLGGVPGSRWEWEA